MIGEAMDYKVVVVREELQVDAISELEKTVKALLEDGWKLQGGVSVSNLQIGYLFTQAMTK